MWSKPNYVEGSNCYVVVAVVNIGVVVLIILKLFIRVLLSNLSNLT